MDQEKLDWMKEVGMKEFERPMKYYLRSGIYSEEYIANTPLEELKRKYALLQRSEGMIIAHAKENV